MSWVCSPNPDDRINRKSDEQKMTKGPRMRKTIIQKIMNGTVLNLILGLIFIKSISMCDPIK